MIKARTLQAMFQEQIGELPRLLATRIVRDKLKPFGRAGNEKLVGTLVDHLLGGDGGDTMEFDDEDPDGALPRDIVLHFDDTDLAELQRMVAEFEEELPDILKGAAKEVAKVMLRSYKRNWSEWHPHAVAEMDVFKANLQARWGKGFDLLRMLIEMSRDQGTAFHRRASRSRSARHAHLNTALSHLHTRALQIGSEIMTLMEGGFADGAMARWRTLHEVTCVATVLKEGGDELAERYLTHEIVEARKALGQYQVCQEALGYAPFSPREAAKIERDYAAVIGRYGKEFGGEYGWVAAHLSISRPNFSQIEEAAGRAMMRSHYKMASHNVHAGAKGIAYRLGAFDRHFSGIAGATNVGFVEPGQNLGLSLLHFTMLLLPRRWTLDKIALLTVLVDIQGEIAPALAWSERTITKDERRIRKAREESRTRRRGARAESRANGRGLE